MKRILIVLLLIFAIIICLPACGDDQNDDPKPIPENENFAVYNAMFEKEFSNYTISISIKSPTGEAVDETYTVSTEDGVRVVSYRIERLNQFVIDGDIITAPNGYKTVEDGVYDAEVSGSEKFNVPHFKFSYSCLDHSDLSLDGYYYTDIVSIQEFMGLNVSADDADVTLKFNGTEVTSISVSYITESQNTVIVTYTFE